MRRAGLLGLLVAAHFVSLLGVHSAAAQDNLKTYRYSKAGNWTISALYNAGNFLSCYARVSYRNGINVSLIAYENGRWTLQFYNQNWPRRPVSKFRAALEVDGRVLRNTDATYRGRSVFLEIGRSVDPVRSLVSGRVMTIRSNSGTSSFKLTNAYDAANGVAECWLHHKRRRDRSGNDAFNSGQQPRGNNRGAF
ncbi:MAG: hypothetical protein AAF732_22880 [Pseudomonadota bacterium]